MAVRLSRRAFLATAGAAASALALAGCGGASGGGDSSKVIVWYETGLPIADAVKAAIDRYNATKPATPVEAQPQPDLSIKLLVVIGAHDAPDVVIYPRSRAWSLVSRGAAFPLTELATRDHMSGAAFGPGFWQGGMLKDASGHEQLWGMPLGGDANVLAYNTKLLTAAKVQPAPFWSTSTFNAACKALVQRDAKGQLTQTGAILQQGIPFEIWLWQQGADVLSADGKTPAFDNAAGLKALNWLLANLQLNGGAGEIGRLVSGTTLTEGINGVFNHGKLGILPVTYGSYVRLKAGATDLPLRLATLPTLDGGKPSTLSDAIYGFSPQGAANPHPEGVWDFLKWLATDVTTQLSFIKAGAIPALLQAQQAPEAANDPDVQLMLKALTVARNPQDASWQPEVANILNGEVTKALNGQETPQQALDAADSAAKRTIQQDETLSK